MNVKGDYLDDEWAFVICGRIKKKALIMETIRTVITGKFLLSTIITGIKQKIPI